MPVPNEDKCNNCNVNAVWFYMPAADIQYCDGCVPRGCSCNLKDIDDGVTGEQDTDKFGRLYPCIEYMYEEPNDQL